jgi:L-ribulose-5-phosphate 3-epimerase
MCLSGHRRYPIGSSYPEIQKKGMDIMFKAINFALDTGIRIVQIPGYDSAVAIGEASTEETANNFFNNLVKSVKYAATHGIILALENLDIKFTDSIKKTMFYVNKINSPYLQVYSDIGNSFATNQNLKDELDCAKGHIVGLHIKDTVEMVIRRIPFGEGKVDFIKSFQIIKNSGFYGPLVIEMWADDKPNALELAKNARLWIIEKMNKAWN